ncbi:DUF397 domain-containing protein [Actinomadura graeca]|uniref:DUF397 domain-containing protein n=1 Tax=Actinomadura graeca TaxID=2750812 RepID=UPI001E49FD8E|nr:DUF397 domain-containing protein [Actinomadura graeca]
MGKVVWRKSAWSGENGGACVELASVRGVIAIRDSRNPDGPKIHISRGDFLVFTGILKSL